MILDKLLRLIRMQNLTADRLECTTITKNPLMRMANFWSRNLLKYLTFLSTLASPW